MSLNYIYDIALDYVILQGNCQSINEFKFDFAWFML